MMERSATGRIKVFQKRLDALMDQMRDTEEKSKAAASSGDEALKAELDEQAWILCARIWLYRASGPLVLFNRRGQMLDYLSYLDREIREDLKRDPENAREKARLDEVHFAQKIVREMTDFPMF